MLLVATNIYNRGGRLWLQQAACLGILIQHLSLWPGLQDARLPWACLAKTCPVQADTSAEMFYFVSER